MFLLIAVFSAFTAERGARFFSVAFVVFAIGLVVVAIYSSDELFMHRLSGEVNFRIRNFTSRDSSLWTSFPNEGVSASFSFHRATRAISVLPQGRLRPWDLTVYTS